MISSIFNILSMENTEHNRYFLTGYTLFAKMKYTHEKELNKMQNVTIATLLSVKPDGIFTASDWIVKGENKADALGDAFIPDHRLVCTIPDKLLRPGLENTMQVQIHILWIYHDSASRYVGLVADKLDYKIYLVDVYPHSDSDDNCGFTPISDQEILDIANKNNPYLQKLVELSGKPQLLEYQVYSPFSDRFYYVETAHEGQIVMYGVGLNDTRFWYVGWLGKLITKDLYVAYAECSPEAYRQFRQEVPSPYDRARKLAKYQHLFHCYHVIYGKRKKYPELMKLITTRVEEPVGENRISYFMAHPKGTKMEQFSVPAPYWMTAFVEACRKQLGK